jgi:predicted Zn-dependent protease
MQQIRSRVRALVSKGAYTAAITAAAEFARRNPDRAEAYGLLAQAEEIAGYSKAAIQSVSHAISLDPREPIFRLQRGRLYLKVSRLIEAFEEMKHMLDSGEVLPGELIHDAVVACRDEAIQRMQKQARPRRPGLDASTARR